MEWSKLTGKHVYGVLGAGRQGTAAAYDMARFGDAETVTLADVDRKAAKSAARHVNDLCGEDVAESARIDVKDQIQLKRFLDDLDVVLSAVPYFYNLRIAKAAIRARASMCDLGGNTDIVRQELRLDREAKAAGISIVPDCGLDPGMGASLACYGMELLDKTREVHVWCGGLPQKPRPPFNYLLTFNFDGLANEYSGNAVCLRGGEIVEVPCFEDLEMLDFPQPIGRLEAFLTAGGTSTCPWTFKDKLSVFQVKTLRYPGSHTQLKTMRDLGLFSDKKIAVDGAKVAPRKLLQALIEPMINLPGEKDLIILRVKCVGEKDGQAAQAVLEVVDYYDEERGFSAMERTTGWHASIVAIMMAQRQIPIGAKPLELAVPGSSFVNEMKRRGIALTGRLSWLPS